MKTYIIPGSTADQLAVNTRASGTMHYTHALVTKADGTAFSWHTSQDLAQKAAGATYAQKVGVKVVPVDVMEGGKAKNVKALTKALEAPKADLGEAMRSPELKKAAKASADKQASKKAAAKAAHPAAKKATPAKKAAAPAGLELAQANLAAAKKANAPVHPGLVWRVNMFEAGMTQAKTAEAMGVAGMTLNRVLNGKGTPPTAALTVAFAKAVNLDVVGAWQQVADYELALALQAK